MKDSRETLIQSIILTFVFTQLTLGVFIAFTDIVYFENIYAREDSWIEWWTVVALLAGSGLNLYRGIVLRKSRGLFFSACLFLLSGLYFFGAGEEISWGQRLFSVESNEFFLRHNSQGETNLHNLIVSGVKINKLIFGLMLGIFVGLYFLVLPPLYRLVPAVKRLINTFAIPVPCLWHIACYVILFAFVQITPSPKRGELLEFGGCWIFFCLNLFPFNREIYRR
jgi:hypothetical protein